MPYTTNVGYEMLKAVAKRLRDRGLREVQVQEEPLTEDQIRPGIYVTPPTDGNGPWDDFREQGTNDRDDVIYACQVTIIGGTLAPFNDDPEDLIDVRQVVRRVFNNRRLDLETWELTDTGSVELGCTVKHGKFQMDTNHPNANKIDISVLVVRCFMREPRTE
ncbi:MAG: hypothetical protein MUE50_03930 [Pirellulaceae bacterium]|jgi:hypothetical protein|nr:hypothetical protein [Pirellulaceae bacterium]